MRLSVISDLTCGFIGSLTTGAACFLFVCALLLEETALEELFLPEAELRAAVLLPEEDLAAPLLPELLLLLFRLEGAVAFAAGFLVVFGLLFEEACLETFLAVEDVPLCAILITPYHTIISEHADIVRIVNPYRAPHKSLIDSLNIRKYVFALAESHAGIYSRYISIETDPIIMQYPAKILQLPMVIYFLTLLIRKQLRKAEISIPIRHGTRRNWSPIASREPISNKAPPSNTGIVMM